MENLTAAGSSFTLASAILPQGIVIREGADDVALFEIDDPEIGRVAAGVNGHGLHWSVQSVITIRISVFPGGANDKALKALTRWNRLQDGTAVNVDSIQGVFVEGVSGETSSFPDLAITHGAIANSMTTEGRFATRTYVFQGVKQLT